MPKELILATQTNKLPSNLSRTGFFEFEHESVLDNLESSGLWIGPREVLEVSSEYRQIIPYIVLRVGNRILSYTRAVAGKEKRLHGRLSIGLGGHVDFPDIIKSSNGIDLHRTLDDAAEREVCEELGCTITGGHKRWAGAIVDNETEVGRVHIGVVGIWSIESIPDDAIAENAIDEIALNTLENLEDSIERMETWSALLMPFIRDLKEMNYT